MLGAVQGAARYTHTVITAELIRGIKALTFIAGALRWLMHEPARRDRDVAEAVAEEHGC